jgi:ArsR family transcriptional regulator
MPLSGVKRRNILTDDDRIYEMQACICKAFAHPSRLRMLDLLSRREFTVSELRQNLNTTIPNVSQHLAILKNAGVVKARREGKQIFYSLAIREVKKACSLIKDVLRARLRAGRELVV